MKRISFFLISVILFAACQNEEDPSDPEQQFIDTKNVEVSLILPDNSTLNLSELTVSSLFTNKEDFINGIASVDLFDDNAIELVYATNAEENIVFMNLINPALTSEVILDSKTTAQSLVMLHPWVMNLSVEARKEAYDAIALMPEFTAYHDLILQGINSGEIDPLASNPVIEAIGNFQHTMLSRVELSKNPLLLEAGEENVSLTNKLSSMAYTLQLYDVNNEPVGEEYLVEGVNKEILSWSTIGGVVTGNFDLFQPQQKVFSTPSENQVYTLKADSWAGDASWRNGATISASIVGIVSTTLSTVMKNSSCAFSIGSFFYGNTSTVIQQMTNNELTISQGMGQLIASIGNTSNSLHGIINSCPGNYSFGSQAFNQAIKALSLIGNLENGALLFFNIVDIAQYDSQIDFCFEKTAEEVIECSDKMSGEWNFEFINSQCVAAGTITFEEDGSLIIENPLSIEGFNEGEVTSSYTLNEGVLEINYLRDYDLCAAPPGSPDFVDVIEQLTIQVEVDEDNGFQGSYTYAYSGDGIKTCNIQTPNCSGEIVVFQ
ncbi:hypothetical protein Q4534_18470 [Cyclobacterium sp. 1_MG-2023]|uniref:hypothetical protein n=1 Tax=Cyclobacterium sp. 1_MG-2023 TaxID=3062681 RepID=UPI0026E2ED8C|nr:hypothetical protein [Cyclobacterium sp. 1_MG-2023]MDO6439416.1 hypothetical protein [Cyclobacterium sp. 1_MG-2023]